MLIGICFIYHRKLYPISLHEEKGYRTAENLREHKFSRITNKHARKKKIRNFYFRDKVTMSGHIPTVSRMEMVTNGVYFNVETIVRFPRLSKRVGRRRQKTAIPIGRVANVKNQPPNFRQLIPCA